MDYPPSVNHYYNRTRWGGLMISRRGKEYREKACELLKEHSGFFSTSKKLHVEILASFPDRRKRDLDNILKCLLDSITHAGVWNDDSLLTKISIENTGEIIKGGCLKITIYSFMELESS